MAKEASYHPALLVLASGILTSGAWLMGPFPLLMFVSLAPIIALTDRAKNTATVWETMEWPLIGLAVFFIAAHHFDFSHIVSSLTLAIAFTLTLVAHVWVQHTLGPRAGKLTILLFWLALEYVLLKTLPQHAIFLGDALQWVPQWMRWNSHTGFLGGSLWILLVNLAVYQVVLSKEPFQWPWIIAALICLGAPFAYSYGLKSIPLTRDDMMNFYTGSGGITDLTYLARGEFVVRSAAWVSTLVLLFTFVKHQTSK
jgi:apolipoprotein N-acyltransferase